MSNGETGKKRVRVNVAKRTATRTRISVVLFAVAFAILFGRAFQLAILQHEFLTSKSEENTKHKVKLLPDRGTIYDRHGEPLAVTVRADSVYVRPSKVVNSLDTARKVAAALDLDVAFVLDKVTAKKKFVWIKRQASPERSEELLALQLPGVGAIQEKVRSYPYKQLGGSLLGVTGLHSTESEGLEGLEGLELVYDQYLSSAPSALRGERDALGKLILRDGMLFEATEKGRALKLSVCSKIQFFADTALAEAFEKTQAKTACAIVMDPHTGEVLAMASQPGFDPNFAGSYKRNTAITDLFEPGSTFKPFVLAAALETGAVTLNEPIFCENGSYRFGGHTIHDTHNYGTLNPAEILKVSSNIGATKLAVKLGKTKWHAAIRAFGFGRKTGIDFAGERNGVVHDVSKWRTINLSTTSFGQGISVTPLQLLTAFSALVNGGQLMRPYLVREVLDKTGNPVKRINQQRVARVISEKTSAQVARVLATVTETGGTGTRAAIPGYTVAGKTGTAQKAYAGGYSKTARVGSFIGCVPAEDPEIAILVVIDEPQGSMNDKYGGVCAAPVFKSIAEQTLAHRRRYGQQAPGADKMRSILTEAKAPIAQPQQLAMSEPSDPNAMPDLSGLSVRNVLRLARQRKIDLTIIGSGVAVRQSPEPGTVLDEARHGTVLFRPAS
jgi:cell division protein FtsI (penicillin-binding protein 3)